MNFEIFKNIKLFEIKEILDLRDEYILFFLFNLFQIQNYEFNYILRGKADIENIKRRNQQDIEKIRKFTLDQFVSELLPVIDNFERALILLNDTKANFSSIFEGINLTFKIFIDVLIKFGIDIIKEINIPFDPSIHQAITVVNSKNMKNNYIINIIQKGYLLNGRLIRPAMVTVSKCG